MTAANGSKLKAFRELYELITFYYENRDQPVPEDFDFYAEVRQHCVTLDLNPEELIEEFDLGFSSR